MGLDATNPVFGGLRTTKAQTRLPFCADWSAPLLFTYWKVSYLNLLQANFNFLASLCSWGDWFESRFVWNPEDMFCRDKAHMSHDIKMSVNQVKTHISLASAQSDQPLMSALTKRESIIPQRAHSEDWSDFGHTHFVVFVVSCHSSIVTNQFPDDGTLFSGPLNYGNTIIWHKLLCEQRHNPWICLFV